MSFVHSPRAAASLLMTVLGLGIAVAHPSGICDAHEGAVQPAGAGSPADSAAVSVGRAIFNGVLARVGPLFNAASCNTCHPNGGRGAGPTGDGATPVGLELQLELPAGHAPAASGGGMPAASSAGQSVPAPAVVAAGAADPASSGPSSNDPSSYVVPVDPALGDPIYGHVFNTASMSPVAAEGVVTVRYSEIYGYYYPDGKRWIMHVPHYQLSHLSRGALAPETIIKPRLAPALFGVTLLEAVPAPLRGRFGWQGSAESVRDQTTRAFAREMGLTTSDRPADDCTAYEQDCRSQGSGAPEVSDEQLRALLAFEQSLAAPVASTAGSASLGAQLFLEIGCPACHRPTLPVKLRRPDHSIARDTITPYSDLQLHDMGMEMADQDVSGRRVLSRWRTAPLWGLAYRLRTETHPTYLHDGRARSVEEAILWHAGEAAAARRRFVELGPRSRAALLGWLETL